MRHFFWERETVHWREFTNQWRHRCVRPRNIGVHANITYNKRLAHKKQNKCPNPHFSTYLKLCWLTTKHPVLCRCNHVFRLKCCQNRLILELSSCFRLCCSYFWAWFYSQALLLHFPFSKGISGGLQMIAKRAMTPTLPFSHYIVHTGQPKSPGLKFNLC